MLSIRSSEDMAVALASPIDDKLRRLLTERRAQLLEDGDGLDLEELVHIVVVQPGDTLALIENEAGVPIATNLVDGSRYGDPEFTDLFEWVQDHGGWIEAVMVLSDDGFGIMLFVADDPRVDPTLLGLLREHA